MSTGNKTVGKLLKKMINGDRRWSTDSLLIADGILRLFEKPPSTWIAYLVGLQIADDVAGIENSRKQISEDQIDERTWSFDALADAWNAYLVVGRDGANSECVVVVETLDPFELMDVGGVLNTYRLDGQRRVPPNKKPLSIDLREMGLLR